jgi:hypothetical protein
MSTDDNDSVTEPGYVVSRRIDIGAGKPGCNKRKNTEKGEESINNIFLVERG